MRILIIVNLVVCFLSLLNIQYTPSDYAKICKVYRMFFLELDYGDIHKYICTMLYL